MGTKGKPTRAFALVGVGLFLGVGVCATVLLVGRTPPKKPPPVVEETADRQEVVVAAKQPQQPTMRAQVRQAIATSPVKAPSQLEDYLSSLEGAARARGKVTALDIEPGVAAAMEQDGPERARDFAERMRMLQQELAPAAAPAAVAPTRESMGAALAAIAGSSGEERRALERQYLRAADQLPQDEQIERVAELNATLPRTRPQSSPPKMDDRHRLAELARPE